MDLREAYNILGVVEGISDEELKDKHRELVFKHHPDRNKDQPDKLKEINAAYQCVREHRDHPEKYQQQMPGGFNFVDLGDIFSQFTNMGGGNRRSNIPSPVVNVNISFRESVLGAEREIKYKRQAKCDDCGGQGIQRIKNACTYCDGFGRKVVNSPGMMFSSQCDRCRGGGIKNNKCVKCNSSGRIENDITCNIGTPPGVIDGATLELKHAGHYNGHSMFGEDFGSVAVKITVEKDPDMKLVGNDVVSELKISLMEALVGGTYKVKTVFDEKEIVVKPLAKHMDEVKLEGAAVRGTDGKHRVVINIQYPDDIDSLIGYLKGK